MWKIRVNKALCKFGLTGDENNARLDLTFREKLAQFYYNLLDDFPGEKVRISLSNLPFVTQRDNVNTPTE